MSGYIGNIPTPQATQTRDTFTATAGQTSFATSGYTPSFLDVFLNGVHLVNGTDYTATNGSDVVLTSGAALNDTLEVVAFSTFQTGDFVPSTGGTFSGNVTVSGSLTVSGAGSFTGTDALKVPVGTDAQRPTPATGMVRFNSTSTSFEGYDGTAWAAIGGGGGGYFKGENGAVGDATTGPGDIFRINEQTLNTSTTIGAAENASCTGPLAIASGVTLTVSGNLSIV